MVTDIEVELRGRLSVEDYQRLLQHLKENGTFVETKKRLLLDYSTFIEGEGVGNRQRDIRLRVTNGRPEIMTKLGGWGGDEHRREISILTEKGSFDRLVETYGVLGYTKAIVAERSTEVFLYQGFEFALVTVPNHSYYFEIEKMARDAENVTQVKADMRSLCVELLLTLFDDNGFYAYIEELNRDANGIFDFKDFEPDYFAKRYSI